MKRNRLPRRRACPQVASLVGEVRMRLDSVRASGFVADGLVGCTRRCLLEIQLEDTLHCADADVGPTRSVWFAISWFLGVSEKQK